MTGDHRRVQHGRRKPDDEELRKILERNRDEEKEHAAMLIEWIRRHDKAFARELKDYLFTEARYRDREGIGADHSNRGW